MESPVITFRVDEHLLKFLNSLSETWGCSRSEAVRIMIRSYLGLLEGRFLSLLSDDELERWGDLGVMLKALKYSEDVSPAVANAKLKDVITDIEMLLGASFIEAEGGAIDNGEVDG